MSATWRGSPPLRAEAAVVEQQHGEPGGREALGVGGQPHVAHRREPVRHHDARLGAVRPVEPGGDLARQRDVLAVQNGIHSAGIHGLEAARVVGHQRAGVAARGARVDVLAELVEAQHQPHGRRDLEIRGVRLLAADHALVEQRVDAVELAGQRLQARPARSRPGAASAARRRAGSPAASRIEHAAHRQIGEPARKLAIASVSLPIAQRASWRTPSWSTESAHASSPSLGSGNIGGSGLSASSARAIFIVPEIRRPSSVHHRHGRAAVAHQRQDRPVRHVRQVHPRELDALVAQHQLGADARDASRRVPTSFARISPPAPGRRAGAAASAAGTCSTAAAA